MQIACTNGHSCATLQFEHARARLHSNPFWWPTRLEHGCSRRGKGRGEQRWVHMLPFEIDRRLLWSSTSSSSAVSLLLLRRAGVGAFLSCSLVTTRRTAARRARRRGEERGRTTHTSTGRPTSVEQLEAHPLQQQRSNSIAPPSLQRRLPRGWPHLQQQRWQQQSQQLHQQQPQQHQLVRQLHRHQPAWSHSIAPNGSVN